MAQKKSLIKTHLPLKSYLYASGIAGLRPTLAFDENWIDEISTILRLFSRSFNRLTKFYECCKNLQYFKNLISIPELPSVSRFLSRNLFSFI